MSEESKEESPVHNMQMFWEALEVREKERDCYRELAKKALLSNFVFNAVLGFFLFKEVIVGFGVDQRWEVAFDASLGIYFTGAAVRCFVARRKLTKPSF